MEINENEIRIVTLEDELQKKSKQKAKKEATQKGSSKAVSSKENGKTESEEAVSITEQYKERNWLVIMGAFVFAMFMVTFLSILAFQLIKLGDVDKTLQVFTTVSVSVFAVVNPIIAYFFGKQSRNK
jgi:cation transport ATPase